MYKVIICIDGRFMVNGYNVLYFAQLALKPTFLDRSENTFEYFQSSPVPSGTFHTLSRWNGYTREVERSSLKRLSVLGTPKRFCHLPTLFVFRRKI